MEIQPVILTGTKVRMHPLELVHADALERFAYRPELWNWTINEVRSRDDLFCYLERALEEHKSGTSLPFVTVDVASGTIVGSSRFGNIDIPNRKAEIGWTWIDPEWQRSYINTEAKLLMLTHAFETWKCIRVELKTDALNVRSQTAMRRIGAVEEGTLRNHMITDSGRYRDSVYFSIIESEWIGIKTNLIQNLEKYL